MIDSQTPLVIN